MASLKTAADIAGIYKSGQVTGKFLDVIGEHIKPGVTTAELDSFASGFISKHGGIPTFLGYNGFPGHICVSVNEEIVHGIPGGRALNEGDIVSIDVGVTLEGYVSDSARTYVVGNTVLGDDVLRLLDGTRESLFAGIAAVRGGKPVRLVSRAIETVLKSAKLGIVRDLTGHGVGFALHEEPTVYNYDPGTRLPLVENGLVVALEPMATLGSDQILLASDDWTYVTADGSLAAHYEHTVACWDNNVFILTDPDNDEARQAFG